MVTPKRVSDLEVSQDLRLQHREWVFERIGWAVMLVLAIATLLGLFGRGWLSAASVGDQNALSVGYERITRLFSSTELTVALGPGATRGDTARVWLDRGFMQSVQVLDVVPRPAQVQAGSDRLIYVFPLAEPGRPTTITFQIQPQHPWWHTGRIGVPGGEVYQFSQFVFP